MKKIQKFVLLIICLSIILSCLSFVACIDNEEDKKEDIRYDVTIKIGNNFGKEWIFTPDIEELTYEFDYTGEEMRFFVKAYQLPDHPTLSDKWLKYEGYGANSIISSYLFTDINGKQSFPRIICERGTYLITYHAESGSDIWNSKFIQLYIIVK